MTNQEIQHNPTDSKNFPRKRQQDLKDFYLTEEEARTLNMNIPLSVADFAEKLRAIRIPEQVKKLFGTTITARLEEEDQVHVERDQGYQFFTISAKGENFGLFIESRTSQKGKRYEILMLTPAAAQANILKWYIK